MEWKWEIHQPAPSLANRERIRVTINRHGIIYLNGPTFKALGDPEAVVLMYDRRRSTIGVTGVSAERREAYAFKRKSGAANFGGRCIYARTFCKDFGINPSETLLFTEASINKDGILLLDLNAVKPSTRKR